MRAAQILLNSALVAAVASAVAGCDDPAPPPAVAAARAKKAAAAAPVPAALARPAFQYAYNPLVKRDPFRSPLDELTAAGNQTSEACTEPLCQFDLEQLVLVAVVSGDANPVAMVEDPQNRGHIVRRNTKMGKQGGKVTQILRDSITVTEFWTAPDGKVNPNPVNMKLKADPQALPAMDLVTGKLVQ